MWLGHIGRGRGYSLFVYRHWSPDLYPNSLVDANTFEQTGTAFQKMVKGLVTCRGSLVDTS